MTNMKELSDEQRAALAGIQVGDLILIQKTTPPLAAYDDNYPGDSTDDAESGDNNSGGQDEQAGNKDDDDASDHNSDNESQQKDEEESAAEDPDDTEATEIIVSPKMFVVSAISQDAAGIITDVQVSRLTYSSTVSSNDTHTYQIYRNDCVHNHPSTCGQTETLCPAASSITKILADKTFRLMIKPAGDVVKNTDQDVRGTSNRGRCITGCQNGYLASHEMLRSMIKDYDPPTLSVSDQDRTRIMPSVCPVCFGIDVLQQQQNLQGSLLLGAAPDFGEVIDFLGSLDARRRELGYYFRQFDEREWGMVFDDMMEEEEYDGQDDDNGRWEHWAEAMDPNGTIQARPASDATIASLTRKNANDAALGEDPFCKICQEEVQGVQRVIELPCGHADHHEDCIAQWLKYNTTCPTCRSLVPAADDDATPKAAIEQVELDGDDTIMSDF